MCMEKPQFYFIKRKDGTSEFIEFINSLPDKDSAKLLATIKKTEEHGLTRCTKDGVDKKVRF